MKKKKRVEDSIHNELSNKEIEFNNSERIRLNKEKHIEDSIHNELSKKEIIFNNSDFGHFVNQLKSYTSLSDEDFEKKKLECINNNIKKCEFGSAFKEKIEKNGLYNLKSFCPLLRIIVCTNIEIPKELINAPIVIIPTELGFVGTKLCISKAMIIYLNDDISYLMQYFLKDGMYSDNTIDTKGNISICKGQIQIKKTSDKYLFNSKAHTPRGVTDIVLVPMNTGKYRKGKCYYSFWTNDDKSIEDPIKKLTKSEVSKTIEERLKFPN